MTSPLLNFQPNAGARRDQKSEPKVHDDHELVPASPEDWNPLVSVHDKTARKLKPRHIQLIGIGG